MNGVLRGIVWDVIGVCWNKVMENREKNARRVLFVVVIENVKTGAKNVSNPCSRELAENFRDQFNKRAQAEYYREIPPAAARVELYEPPSKMQLSKKDL